jgi:pyruvate,water dikinase
MELLYDFTDPEATLLAHAGGKGASLARLVQAGFPVPDGFIVTARAYREFIANDKELAKEVRDLDFENADRLHKQCEVIRNRLRDTPLPDGLKACLEDSTVSLLASGPVSVRSSSTMEDLAGAAFAGQHDTFLNMTTPDAVEKSIARCFASLWGDRAVRYRHEYGFGQANLSMAVVVQSMVASEVAGVAFTLNPISGDLGQIAVNAAYGLGETVVSGEGDVDQYLLSKKDGSIVEQTIGMKTHQIVGQQDGTQVIEVEPRRRDLSCLNHSQLSELARLATRAESFYGFPQDIEWAIVDNSLYLLQSRPVTQFPERWTRDESAERFPNPITPLTWDYTFDGFHESLAFSLNLMGMPPFNGRWFDRFEGYVYGNQTAVQLFTGGRQVSFSTLEELEAMIPQIRETYGWVQRLPVAWARDLDGYLLELGRLSAVDITEFNTGQLWDHLNKIDELGRHYFLPNIAISITQGVLHKVLYGTLVLLVGSRQAPEVHDALTSYCETKTNLVNRDLYRLYEAVRRFPELEKLLASSDRRELLESGRLSEFPDFETRFDKFLLDHGHREVDYDAYHPTWAGQPWVVLENLRLMLLRDEVEVPQERERELRVRQQQADLKLYESAPANLHFFLSELVRLVRTYTALDDLEHYQTTRLSLPFRATLIEIGKRLRNREILREPEDVFFLRKETLAGLMEGSVEETEARREAHKSHEDYIRQVQTLPSHVWGESPESAAREGDLHGLPGSAGTAEGPVCLVRTVDDFPRFPAGSVLVARTTNPSWTPLFYSACAVITESGGPLSHGAVTAREVGLPAVMGVQNALFTLREGERVRVDGAAGTVSRLD